MYGFDTKGNTKHALFSYTKPGSHLRTTRRKFPFKVNRKRSHDEKRNCFVMFFDVLVEDVNQEASSLPVFLFPGKCFFLVFALTSFSSLHLSYTLHLQIISICVYLTYSCFRQNVERMYFPGKLGNLTQREQRTESFISGLLLSHFKISQFSMHFSNSLV